MPLWLGSFSYYLDAPSSFYFYFKSCTLSKVFSGTQSLAAPSCRFVQWFHQPPTPSQILVFPSQIYNLCSAQCGNRPQLSRLSARIYKKKRIVVINNNVWFCLFLFIYVLIRTLVVCKCTMRVWTKECIPILLCLFWCLMSENVDYTSPNIAAIVTP